MHLEKWWLVFRVGNEGHRQPLGRSIYEDSVNKGDYALSTDVD